jgi:hypothetical protein
MVSNLHLGGFFSAGSNTQADNTKHQQNPWAESGRTIVGSAGS